MCPLVACIAEEYSARITSTGAFQGGGKPAKEQHCCFFLRHINAFSLFFSDSLILVCNTYST